jgi:unsaturated rhamnogalacturonyl hydrolase
MILMSSSRATQIGAIRYRRLLAAITAALCVGTWACAWSQQEAWPQRAADSAMKQWPAARLASPETKATSKRSVALLLDGMDAVWYDTANGAYYQYAKQAIDAMLGPDGSIPAYQASANSQDDIALGRQLLLLYRATLDARYYKAAALLRQQVSARSGRPQPDWLYTAEPFYAEYAHVFQEPQDFADITRQFTLAEERPHATGWYMMALVDTLPYYPANDPGRAALLAILQRTAATVAGDQNKTTGLWHQAGDHGKYLEPSTACMLVYALQKGARLGYLPESYSKNAASAWRGILTHSVEAGANGYVTLTDTISTSDQSKDAGKGAHSSAADDDDRGGFGAFLLAATEMELAPEARLARGQTVMMDAWFNSQQRTNAAGQKEYFHYKWDDYSFSGFSIFGHIFASHGAALDTLYSAPTLEKLKGAQYYIIVSPDIPVKNPHPHYVQPEDAQQVAEWVKQGGVLALMENDPPNADIGHLDLIADQFGIHFNDVLSHHVVGDDFAAGQIAVRGGGPVFFHPHTLYMKDTCTISVHGAARALLEDKGDIMMASAKYGKGTVFAVVDPWLYNEYTDGRKGPPVHDNYAGGKELVLWLLKQRQGNAEISAKK